MPMPSTSSPGHVVAVALRTDLIAVVEASQPTKIWVQKLREGNARGEGFFLVAPGPVRVLRLSQDTDGLEPHGVYMAAATARECFVFQAVPGSEALPLDLEVLPPHLPSLCFDETGSLLAVAGAGLANIAVVQSLEAAPFATALVPTDGEDQPLVQACCFLHASFAHALAAAHATALLLYDLRLGSAGAVAAHEHALTQAVTAICPHRQEGVLLLGGHGKVQILQVRHGLKCSALAELALGADVPMWLRDETSQGLNALSQSATNQRPDHGVLALAAASCKVRGLGLHGTAAVAVSSEALFAVLGHEQTAERLCTLPALGAASAVVESTGGAVLLAVGHAFDTGGELLRLSWPELQVAQLGEEERHAIHTTALSSLLQDVQDSAAPADPPICSVVPLGPIAPESMLGRALSSSGTRRAGSMPVAKRAGRSSKTPSNQPVTFHRKVKSAGYGPPTEAPRVLGRPRINSRPAALPKPDFGPRAAAQRPPSAGRVAESGLRVGPPLEHSPEMAIRACEGYAATDVCFSPQATHLLVAGSDRTVSAYRMPLRRPNGPPGSSHGSRPLGLAGHQGDILSMCPSYTESHSTGGGGGPLLLTAGDDRTARLWALAGPHAGSELIRFDRLKGSRQASGEENPLFEQVQDAQFLCLDGAVALATTTRLAVYRFQLHLQDTSDDIKRLQRLGSYKCCGLLALPKEPTAGQSLVAIAANNAVLSGTVLVASSNKRVYVWDVAAEKVLAAVNAHARPLTCLRLAQPHAAAPAASMDVFYSAGLDGIVKLWDLRSMQECQSFRGGHVHSAQRMRCRLSSCLRYLGVPSEDGSVCVYDVRNGQVLGTKHCHRDACVAVDLQPRSGSMVSCGFDGMVQFFRAPSTGAGRGGGGGIREPRQRESAGPGGPLREVEMELPF